MAHGYHEVDADILWVTAKVDLPDLIGRVLSSLEGSL